MTEPSSVPENTFYPESSLFEIKHTANAGRAIFATQDIPKDTIILESDFNSVVVILQEYRREVCAHCFAYERGRNLKLRDAPSNFCFCSLDCYDKWKVATGELGIQGWTQLETFIKSKAGRGGGNGLFNGVPEPTDEDGDVNMGDYPRHPSKDEIEHLWSSVESAAERIRETRVGTTSKSHRNVVQEALNVFPRPEGLYFLLSGILLHYQSTNSPDLNKKNVWEAHLSLASYDLPYLSASHLHRHVHSYLQLLAILPVELLSSITPQVCRQIVMHDVHNAFGIRSLDDAGSEFFGWAVWPSASYFNHSCKSNVGKDRDKRTWSFWTRSDVKAGEELTISYLGGDEHDLNVKERGDRTESIWGFVCACSRCSDEQKGLVI
jgi:hypothetical protein